DWMSDEGKRKLEEYGIAPPTGKSAVNDGPIMIPMAVKCPQCHSLNTREVTRFGSTACKALYTCNDCLEPFEYFKVHYGTRTMTQTITAPARKRARFNALTVSEIRQLTDAAIEVAFAIPEELIEDYNYVPGQYVALRAEIDGEEVRRSYSICAE